MYVSDQTIENVPQPQHYFKHKLERILKQERFRQEHEPEFSLLTKRELEVFRLLIRDFNNKQIADYLNISRHTVEQHRKNINKKLDTHSIINLVDYALAFNLI